MVPFIFIIRVKQTLWRLCHSVARSNGLNAYHTQSIYSVNASEFTRGEWEVPEAIPSYTVYSRLLYCIALFGYMRGARLLALLVGAQRARIFPLNVSLAPTIVLTCMRSFSRVRRVISTPPPSRLRSVILCFDAD